jgi:hypothetical protein
VSDEFVYIPVPAKWSQEIYRRLAELANESSEAGQDELPVDRDELLVARMFMEGQHEQRRLMLLLAERPDRWFTTPELAEMLGYESAKVLAGLLGAFGRKAKHRYGGRTPWDSEWDSSAELARHSMRSDVARIIRSTAAES